MKTKRAGSKRSLILRMLGRQKGWVAAAFLLFIVNALAILSVTKVTVAMVDDAIVSRSKPLAPFINQILVLAAISFVVGLIQRLVSLRLSYQLEFDLRTRMYRAVHSAHPDRFRGMASGQLVTRSLTDLKLIEQFLQFAPTIVGILPLFVGVGIYMLIINPVIAVVSMGGLPVNIWLLRRFRTRLWGLSFAELNERSEVASAIDEPVRGIRVVRAFGREEYERSRVAAVALRTYRFAMTRWRLLARYDVPLKFAPVVFQASLLFVGARLMRTHSLTTGEFLQAFQVNSYIILVANLVDEAASMWQYLRSAQQRVDEVLDLAEAPPAPGVAMPPVGEGLHLVDAVVSFDGRRVVDVADLVVRPGELVVVQGGPSSGKSTLAAIASGALVPDSGLALLENVSLDELDEADLRRAVRVASEEPYLFAATVRDNLELGVDGTAEDDAIATALRVAAADDFVATLTGGLDATVGDRGLTLSGGQRQRLGLARALVSPPRVLVLDDALSAVNPSLEVEILKRVRATYPEIGILCMSRRSGASTIADRTLQMPDPQDAQILVVPPLVEEADLSALAEAANVVASLRLSDDEPGVSEADATRDSRPRPFEVLAPFRRFAIGALVVLALQSAVKYAPEVMLGEIADKVKEPVVHTDRLAALLLVLGLVGALSAYGFRVLSERVAQGALYVLRRRVFQRLSRLGIDFYDRELPGQVAARVVSDLDTLQTFVERSMFLFCTTFASAFAGLAVVLVMAPVVFPIVAAMAAFMVVGSAIQYPLATRAFSSSRDRLGEVTSTFEEDFGARDAIRGYGAIPRQTQRFDRQSLGLRQARRHAGIVNAVFSDLMQFASQAMAALVLYRSGNLVLAGTISVGSALTLRQVAQTSTQPLGALSFLYSNLLEARVSWDRLRQPFDVAVLPPPNDAAVRCPPLNGDIEFDSVGFAYPQTDRPVLHDLSLRIPAGSVASMVGYTGAGKSTISKLLLRTYDPDVGCVRVDGIDLRSVTLGSYRERISVVPQDAFLFKGTVASNIAYGRLDATPEEIAAAAAAVCADEVLGSLPGGYDCVVDEAARNLTAAQRQLIALARAWLAAPDVLVLDEATSCLDARLERRVLEAVGRLGCTTLMVTHRDNVVAASDLVIVLEEGRVVEVGTPTELRGAGGAYDRLWVQEPEAEPEPV